MLAHSGEILFSLIIKSETPGVSYRVPRVVGMAGEFQSRPGRKVMTLRHSGDSRIGTIDNSRPFLGSTWQATCQQEDMWCK